MSKFINLIRQKFGRLEVLKRANNAKDGHARWLCRCDCKNKIIVRGIDLKNGHTKSCGCLRIKHGYSGEKIYGIWQAMIQRCINPNNKKYPIYGGRGITVCDRWRNSFENFNKDMGKDWKLGLTLERRNNEKGYYKKNCYWATRTE